MEKNTTMQHLKVKSHVSLEKLKELTNTQTEVRSFKEWQIIYLVSTNQGKTAEEIAEFLGLNKSKLYRIIRSYNKHGIKWRDKKHWGGRRDATSHLTIGQEKELMNSLKDKASKGLLLTASDIRKQVELKVGKVVSDDYLWDLFNRHEWGKKSPMPKHPKSSKAKQEEFKKNSKKAWMPSR